MFYLMFIVDPRKNEKNRHFMTSTKDVMKIEKQLAISITMHDKISVC